MLGGSAAAGDLLASVLSWIRRSREFSVVYFVNSVGLYTAAEARRRETRLRLIELFKTVTCGGGRCRVTTCSYDEQARTVAARL